MCTEDVEIYADDERNDEKVRMRVWKQVDVWKGGACWEGVRKFWFFGLDRWSPGEKSWKFFEKFLNFLKMAWMVKESVARRMVAV